MSTRGKRHIYYTSKNPEVGSWILEDLRVVGLTFVLGLTIYLLIIMAVAIWLINFHNLPVRLNHGRVCQKTKLPSKNLTDFGLSFASSRPPTAFPDQSLPGTNPPEKSEVLKAKRIIMLHNFKW